jgi:hypothetical protein
VAFDVVGEGWCADDEDHIMAREPVHDALAHGRQEAAEQRMVLGEAAAPAHGGHIDARLVAFGQGLDGLEGLAAVHGRSDHEGRCARTLQRLAYAVQQAWVGSGLEADFAQRDGLAGHIPVIGGNGDEDRAARLLHGDVVGTRQGLGHVLGACGLAAPLHIGLGQLGGLVGVQEGSNCSSERVCWPAVMTMGVRFLKAVKILAMAWPTPAAECRFTKLALRVAWA